jgi:peroxiredoxin
VWAVVVGVVGVTVLLVSGGGNGKSKALSGKAPAFTMESTAGKQVSLSDYSGKNVLLYFSEGVGCDACFYQMVDIQKNLSKFTADNTVVLPVVMNSAQDTEQAMAQFGLKTPFLIDSTGQVSSEYHVLGTGMHANLPGHAFVLVNAAGDLVWSQDYPSMYVSTGSLLSKISSLVKT